jgi:hypothetical protein
MPRFAKVRDAAEPATITALKEDGWSVSRLEPVGNDHGLPDLVLGKDGWTTLAEVKNPPGPKGGRKGKKLTDHQQTWHDGWKGATPLMLDRATPTANVDVANAWLMRMQGVCPCASDISDPGDHLPLCPWSNPEYPGDGSDIPW